MLQISTTSADQGFRQSDYSRHANDALQGFLARHFLCCPGGICNSNVFFSYSPNGSYRSKKIGLRKIVVQYLSNHHGDFHSVPRQVIGFLNIGCPLESLKTNFSHLNGKGLKMTTNRKIQELQEQQVREIAKKRLQSAINSLQRAMYDLEVYADKYDNASTDYDRAKVINYAINHLYCNIQPNLRIDLLADSQAELAKLEANNA